ncbi:MAG: hypothetical protein ACF8XB_05300 [Planctomycetota bacterium JB042]
MDLNDIWQGNKRFILGVGAGFVVFLIGQATIGSLWSATGAAQTVRSNSGKLNRLETPSRSQASTVAGENRELEERLEALVERMRFTTHEDYVLPAREPSPDLLYNEIRSSARDALVDVAARRNIQVVETLGLPEFTPSGREAIQRCLSGLNVVEQVVEAAILAGVRAVPEIEIVEERGRGRKSAESFVVPLRVRFRIEGSTASIAEVVEGIVRGDGRFLAIEDARIDVDSKRAYGLTVLKMTVAALNIDPEVRVLGDER